jgi:hypothetical protein
MAIKDFAMSWPTILFNKSGLPQKLIIKNNTESKFSTNKMTISKRVYKPIHFILDSKNSYTITMISESINKITVPFKKKP